MCRTSENIRTNLSFLEWSSVFGDTRMTTALPKRLTRKCELLQNYLMSLSNQMQDKYSLCTRKLKIDLKVI